MRFRSGPLGAEAATDRPRGEMEPRVSTGEQPSFGMAQRRVDEVDDRVSENLGELDRFRPDSELHGLGCRVDLIAGEGDDAGELNAVEEHEQARNPGLRIHVRVGEESAGHLPSMVGLVVPTLEATRPELDAEGAQLVSSQPAGEWCQRVPLARRVREKRVEATLRERGERLVLRSDFVQERGAVLERGSLPLEASRRARRAARHRPEYARRTEQLPGAVPAQRNRSPHGALITEWLSLTGLRWSELRGLRVGDLQDVPFPTVRVLRAASDGYAEKSPKTARGRRTVPLVARAHEIAEEWAAGKGPTDYLATSVTGLQLRGTYFRRAVAWTTTSPDHTIHDLRHFAASTWLRQGVPINQAAAWLGDDPRTVLRVYAHVLGEAQDIEALRRLNASLP